jgi:hypothetical protein
MLDGFLGNSSLTTLVLARTRMTESGAYHLSQASSCLACIPCKPVNR